MYSTFFPFMRLLWPGGIEIRQYLKVLERMQWLSQSDLEAIQFKKIQNLLKYAYENVPYYRDKYRNEDIHPNDVKSRKDFSALPFLTREDVNQHLDSLVSTQFRHKVYKDKTGGSTGEPMRFYTERSSARWGGAIQIRGRRWFGVNEGDKMAWIWGAERDMRRSSIFEHLKDQVKKYRYLSVYSMTKTKLREFANMLMEWQPVIIRAFPSALKIFSEYIKNEGIPGINPKVIETTSEQLMVSDRQLFEEVFNCKVADCYSSRELYEMAYQCPEGGLHVCEPVFLEIISDGQIAQNGQIGEIAATSLTKFGMPFIRYKNNDLGILERNGCSCGRGLPILKKVVGKKYDSIVTIDGTVVDGQFVSTIFREKPEVVKFQAYQRDRKHLKVRLVCNQMVDMQWIGNIKKELQTMLGDGMHIKISIVDRIELSPSGKHHFLKSEVSTDFLSQNNNSTNAITNIGTSKVN